MTAVSKNPKTWNLQIELRNFPTYQHFGKFPEVPGTSHWPQEVENNAMSKYKGILGSSLLASIFILFSFLFGSSQNFQGKLETFQIP